jgi:chaperonin GroEL
MREEDDMPVILNDDVRDAILRGVTTLAAAVRVTLGPKGRNVILSKTYGLPRITKDGVSVAKEVNLKDDVEEIGVKIIRQATQKIANEAGDGTTTATILSHALYSQGVEAIKSGFDPISINEGIREVSDFVLNRIKDRAVQDFNLGEVSLISANGDQEISDIITEALDSVGCDGTVTVEDGLGKDTVLDITEGMCFDNGFISQLFMTDPESRKAEYDKCTVLVSSEKVERLQQLIPLLQIIANTGVPCVFIAPDFDVEVIKGLAINKMQQGLKLCAVKAPGFGEDRDERLKDIATVTGAKVICSATGQGFDVAEESFFGSVEKFIATESQTILTDGAGTTEDLQERANELRTMIANESIEYKSEKLKERLAKLVGAIAVIRVGADSEIEMKERKDRVEDALFATIAASEEGVVPGGGSLLLQCAEEFIPSEETNLSYNKGIEIALEALRAPFKQLLKNAGLSYTDILRHIKESDFDLGYDIRSGDHINLIERGIIDPAKVTRLAWECSTSIATILLTAEALVYELPEEEN